MEDTNFTVVKYDFHNEDHLNDYHKLFNLLLTELERPIVTIDQLRQNQMNQSPDSRVIIYMAYSKHELVGRLSIQIPLKDNTHRLVFYIFFKKVFYRKEYIKAFFPSLVQTAKEYNRQILVTDSYLPDLITIYKEYGATLALAERSRRLDISSSNVELIQKELVNKLEKLKDYSFVFYKDAFPRDDIQGVCDMMTLVNRLTPIGEMDFEEPERTPEMLLEAEKNDRARGITTIWLYAKEKRSNKYIGYTGMAWNKKSPHFVNQLMTGVVKEHQGKGIAVILKYDLFLRLLKENSQALTIETTNAKINEAMIHINEKLGFKLYREYILCQFSLLKLKSLLF